MTLTLAHATPRVLDEPWLSPTPPKHVWPGTMVQRWNDLFFVNWAYDPEVVQALLPSGLTVDTIDGVAWVSLIPFHLEMRVPGTPTLPYASTFLEANVRTYVRGPDGEPGIWFLSLDASRLSAVTVARRWWRLPYMWSHMRTDRAGQVVRARCERRWPNRPASFDLQIEHGRPRPVSELDDLTRFLACRWRLYSPGAIELPHREIGLQVTVVDHPEWEIAPARIRRLESTMLEAAGLSTPTSEPFACYSPGVTTRFAVRTDC